MGPQVLGVSNGTEGVGHEGVGHKGVQICIPSLETVLSAIVVFLSGRSVLNQGPAPGKGPKMHLLRE